jgi:hypothetical protein
MELELLNQAAQWADTAAAIASNVNSNKLLIVTLLLTFAVMLVDNVDAI